MVSKKKRFGEDEIAIFDDGCIYKRGDYWHFRLWLRAENKYARKSLGTTNRATAIERGKKFYLELLANIENGKKYFSLTAKEGVRLYLEQREKDIGIRRIVKGRHGTITTHLNHWLDFIGRDTKLKDLGRTACDDYFSERIRKAKRGLSHSTLHNEQGTINSMVKYLFRHNEILIDAFDFPKLDTYHIDTNRIKRQTLSIDEYNRFCDLLLRAVLRTSLSRSYHGYSDNDVVGSSVLPTHFEPNWVWGYSKGLTVPTSQTLFAFQASPTVRARGSAMKP